MTTLFADVFAWILSTSLMASVLVLFIFVAKWLLKNRLKPRWAYLLWVLLALRLLLPWTPESSFSVFNMLPFTETRQVMFENESPATFVEPDGKTTVSTPGQPNRTDLALSIESAPTVGKHSSFTQVASMIWLTGTIGFFAYFVFVNVRFSMKIKKEPIVYDPTIHLILQRCKDEMNVHRSITLIRTNQISSPTLLGVLKPKLLMPDFALQALSEEQLRYVFLHELSHVKRHDIAMNWVMNILLTLHWFNPLLWFAFHKMREDQEMACDALALTRINPAESKEYALTIIALLEAFSKPVYLAGATSMTSNKKELKRRILMISSFTKNSYKWSLLGLAVMLLVSGCALTNPKSDSSAPVVNEATGENESQAENIADIEKQAEISDFSISVNDKYLSLGAWDHEVNLEEILGKPLSENIEVLGNGADTHQGARIKTLKYEGLEVNAYSPDDDGNDFWIMGMNVTDGSYMTPMGIGLGDTVEEIKHAYSNVTMVPDGRTDPDNCAYGISDEENYNYLHFEIADGKVKSIKIFNLIN